MNTQHLATYMVFYNANLNSFANKWEAMAGCEESAVSLFQQWIRWRTVPHITPSLYFWFSLSIFTPSSQFPLGQCCCLVLGFSLYLKCVDKNEGGKGDISIPYQYCFGTLSVSHISRRTNLKVLGSWGRKKKGNQHKERRIFSGKRQDYYWH